jgi:hypothetical protein
MVDHEPPRLGGTAADAAVHAFLAAHTTAPIYVGFGSMPITDQQNVWLRGIMVEVAYRLKLPLVLQLPPLPRAAPKDADGTEVSARALKRPRWPSESQPNSGCADWLAAHVLDVSALPPCGGSQEQVHVCHARLFARVAVVIHHGGSGTTHRAFRYVLQTD